MKRYLNTPEKVTQALKEGKAVLDRTGNKYKSINGFIVVSYISGGWGVDHFIGNHGGLYVDEPEPFKLEVGKFYKTRRGDKVVCLCHRGDYYIHRLNSYIVGYWVDKTGRTLFNGIPERTETDSDVVALWEE